MSADENWILGELARASEDSRRRRAAQEDGYARYAEEPRQPAGVMRFLQLLRQTNPSPEVLKVIEELEAEQRTSVETDPGTMEPVSPEHRSWCIADRSHAGFVGDESGMLWCAQCGSGCETDYDQRLPKTGDRVKAGQLIGYANPKPYGFGLLRIASSSDERMVTGGVHEGIEVVPIDEPKPYAEREVSRTPRTVIMERRAVTGPNPTKAQIESLTADLPEFARVSIEGSNVKVSWHEPL